MDVDDGVLEAARAIRPHLANLVDSPNAAADLDRQLADELADTSDRSGSAYRLRRLLNEHEDTAWFLAEVLQGSPHYRPPYQQPRYRKRGTDRTASPAGDPGLIDADRYTCPQRGDYVWYQPEAGTPIPHCPSCQVMLTRG